MKFIVEDPEHKLSVREAALRNAEIKSHSSTVGHQRRRRYGMIPAKNGFYLRVNTVPHMTRIASTSSSASSSTGSASVASRSPAKTDSGWDKEHSIGNEEALARRLYEWSSVPPINLLNNVASPETRSFQFFVERTAHEWSGWQDEVMWSTTMPRIASSSVVLRHALVAISAFHESLSCTDEHQRNNLIRFSKSQGRKATNMLSTQDLKTSPTATIASYLALLCFSKYVNYAMIIDMLTTLHLAMDWIRDQPQRFYGKVPMHEWSIIIKELAPGIDRDRSRFIQLIDHTAALRESPSSHHYVKHRVLVPLRFQHPRQARDCLEHLLNSIAYSAKEYEWAVNYLSPEIQAQVRTWKAAVQELSLKYADHKEPQATLCGLRVACIMGLITILALKSVSEVDYDEYIDDYRDVADAYEFILDCHTPKGPRVRFGCDAGLLGLVGSAAQQCRDPQIRQRLIDLLDRGWTEAGVQSQWYASIARCLKEIEERHIDSPPRRCVDIPSERRVRLHSILFHGGSDVVQLRFLHFPYAKNGRLGNFEVVWHKFRNDIHLHEPLVAEEPQAIFGPSYVALRMKSNSAVPEYFTVSMRRFYFNIPRC